MKTQDIEGVLCVSTADLNAALPFVMKAEEMIGWGFQPHKKIRAGYWWAVKDVPAILLYVRARTLEVEEQLP